MYTLYLKLCKSTFREIYTDISHIFIFCWYCAIIKPHHNGVAQNFDIKIYVVIVIHKQKYKVIPVQDIKAKGSWGALV